VLSSRGVLYVEVRKHVLDSDIILAAGIVDRFAAACRARAMQQPLQQTRLRLASRCCPDGCAQSTLEFCMDLQKSHLSRQKLIVVLCVPNRGSTLKTHPQTKQLHQVTLYRCRRRRCLSP